MRREVRCAVAVLAVLVSASRSFAASPPKKPAAVPAADSGPTISDALCGRGAGFRANLAKALDAFDPVAVPAAWREAEVKNVRPWLDAPSCARASESEFKLYELRHRRLEQLGLWLEREQVTAPIGSALARFRGWRPSPDPWPSSTECDACAALRSSAARVADIASRWPTGTSTKLGAWLAEAAQREALVAELCRAKPPASARAEIEKGFRYYSWTAGGAKLLEVAALFEQPEVATECRGR